MENQNNRTVKSTWAIGGGVLVGLGIGFIYLQQLALACVGCTIAGLGVDFRNKLRFSAVVY